MKEKVFIVVLCVTLFFFSSSFSFAIMTPDEYKLKLMNVNVILSESGNDVKEWLKNEDSGYPDLADKILSLLKDSNPKGKTTVLDAIMGKYKTVAGKSSNDFIQPPYDKNIVKEAYVENWKERNGGEWNSLSDTVKDDYRNTFNYITSHNK